MKLKKTVQSFTRLEYKIRGKLSHYPILYAFIGGIGTVLFWRGVWHIADDISVSSVFSLIIGIILLLITGIFVSAFVGSRLIMTGLIGEQKIAKKEEIEIESEETQLKNLQDTLGRVEKQLSHLDEDMHKKS